MRDLYFLCLCITDTIQILCGVVTLQHRDIATSRLCDTATQCRLQYCEPTLNKRPPPTQASTTSRPHTACKRRERSNRPLLGARKKSGKHKESHREHHDEHHGKHHQEHRKDSQNSPFQEALDQPQEPDNADSEEEPDPAFLGALDYHKFLHGSTRLRSKVTQSPTGASSSSAPPVTPQTQFNREIVESDFLVPKTAFKTKPSTVRETSLPTLFNNTSQFLSEKESAETM